MASRDHKTGRVCVRDPERDDGRLSAHGQIAPAGELFVSLFEQDPADGVRGMEGSGALRQEVEQFFADRVCRPARSRKINSVHK